MFDIKLLENESLQNVYPVFLKAFETVEGHTVVGVSTFIRNLEALDYRGNLSVGVYKDNELVGFCLTGYRMEEGRHFAYTITTGVLPIFRRRGLAKMMVKSIAEILKKYRFDAWFLELLKDDIQAWKIYESLGFKKFRALYTMSKDNYEGVIEPLEIHGMIEVDVNEYWDFTPSWKNIVSPSLIKDNEYKWVYSGSIDQPYAYALYNEQIGVVLQFSVGYSFRKMGYGKDLLKTLERANHCKTLVFTNIPQTSYMREFLQKSGYATVSESDEYILTLKQ